MNGDVEMVRAYLAAHESADWLRATRSHTSSWEAAMGTAQAAVSILDDQLDARDLRWMLVDHRGRFLTLAGFDEIHPPSGAATHHERTPA